MPTTTNWVYYQYDKKYHSSGRPPKWVHKSLSKGTADDHKKEEQANISGARGDLAELSRGQSEDTEEEDNDKDIERGDNDDDVEDGVAVRVLAITRRLDLQRQVIHLLQDDDTI